MKRRGFIGLIGVAASWPLVARAQQSAKIPVVGIVWHAGNEKEENPWFGYVRQAFADLGYIPGKNIIFEDRYAAEIPERFNINAAELARLNVDVLFVNNLPAVRAAKRATSTIPIVFVVADPVRMGVVPSLAHPGGNVTGLSMMNFELDPKRMELFKEAIPNISRIALLVNPDFKDFADVDIAEYGSVAKQHGIIIETFQGRNKEELKAAFSNMAQSHFDGLIVGQSSIYDIYCRELYELALDAGLPTMTLSAVQSDAGALLSYFAPLPELYRAAALLAKRILGGEKPADLPVQQATKFELVLNMKTAKTLGLTFSRQFLSLVDRVIE
jgi:putative tryptophan/tyrosine transport system substrate-binding protein